jgi:hypothetical protein
MAGRFENPSNFRVNWREASGIGKKPLFNLADISLLISRLAEQEFCFRVEIGWPS